MKNIGEVIRQYRLKNNMTQEELGERMFVSKQAVSKWENGKTLPDINTIRKLSEILSIPHDEILGESLKQTKDYKKLLKVLIPVAVITVMISIILLTAFFVAAGGIGAIQRRMQSGVGLITVYRNDELIRVDGYKISGLDRLREGGNGYTFDIDQGYLNGTVRTVAGEKIRFGFFNTNNWHNVQIVIRINDEVGRRKVSQTVTYKTDNGRIAVERSDAGMDENGRADVQMHGLGG
ncbi:MAG: helix-turn-helix transcriptional regulator [Clostridia bacterium]|nr:helix-turn-helix transcriptional regulator [Clostridia bacterium]